MNADLRRLTILALAVVLWGGGVRQFSKLPYAATPQPTPTVDRLAAPPTVYPPTQADDGAQLFWLHCQPCHGDQGQGLTDEWRAQYPPEDQDCWQSGCHGKQPYENGFTVPTAIPAVIGQDSLGRFETMGQVFDFMRAAMPFQDPGHLSEEEYLALTAFLARAHGVWDGRPLDTNNVYQVRLRSATAETVTPPASPAPAGVSQNPQAGNGLVYGAAAVLIIFLTVIAWGIKVFMGHRQRIRELD